MLRTATALAVLALPPVLAPLPAASAQTVAQGVEAAYAQLRAGRVLPAYRAVKPFLGSLGQDARLHAMAAEILARSHRLAGAYELLLRTHQLAPGNPKYVYDLASVRTRQCRYREALEHWRLLESMPFPHGMDGVGQARIRAEAAFQRGVCAKEAGLLPEATEALDRAARMAPDESARAAYQFEYAGLLLDSGRFEEAIRQFRALVRVRPKHDTYLYYLGVALTEAGELQEAERVLREARRQDAGHDRTSLKLGLVYLRMRKLDHAEGMFLAALEANPKLQEAYYNLAKLAALKGNRAEADEHRKRYRELQEEADALTERQRAYRRRIINDPGDEDAYLQSALIFLGHGRTAEGRERLRQLLSINPEHDLAIINLAVSYARAGDDAASLLELDKILERDPGHPVAGFETGRTLARQGRVAESIACFERALPRVTDLRRAAAIHASLARAYGRTGDAKRAREHAQQAKRLMARLEGDR